MAIKEGSENSNKAGADEPLSADVDTRLGVTTSQFVLIDDKDLTQDEMKDDLYRGVKAGDTVKVGELTGRGPDVRRPDPSGATTVENETEQNRDRKTLEDSERARLALQNNTVDPNAPAAPGERLDGIATAANPLGLTTGAPVATGTSAAPDLDPEEAARRGDYTALARIRLANQAREENEHIDVNGDGHIDGSRQAEFTSTMFSRDQYGGFKDPDGGYNDSFGGHYDTFGYKAQDGSYTNTSGESYNAKTNTFTDASGAPMKVPGAVTEIASTDRAAGADFVQFSAMAQADITNGTAPPNAPASRNGEAPVTVDGKAAAARAGGALSTSAPPTSERAQAVGAIGTAIQHNTRVHGGKPVPNWQLLPEAERLEWKLRQQYGAAEASVLSDQKRLLAFIKANQATPGANGKITGPAAATSASVPAVAAANSTAPSPEQPAFHEVSEAEVSKALNSQPIIHHHSDGTVDTARSSADKVEVASGTTWYADSKGGFWDQYGGYYDKTGAYWDTDGTYYSPDGKFSIDPKGATRWTDGSYTDTHGHTVDKDGNYVDFDGTRIKPPEGVDFKAQMIAADSKNERWTPPERPVPLATADTVLPSTMLKDIPFTFTRFPVVPVTPSVTLPDTKLSLTPPVVTAPSLTTGSAIASGLTLTPPSLIATDQKQDAAFKVDTSRFAQAQTCSATPTSSSTFSNLFGSVHDWLMGSNKPTQDTKYLNACTASSSSPLALNSGSLNLTVSPSLLTVDAKTTAAAPKPGL